jgi:hypothetical protein
VKLSAIIWDVLYALPLLAMVAIWWIGRIKPNLFTRVSEVIELIMVKRTTRMAVIPFGGGLAGTSLATNREL